MARLRSRFGPCRGFLALLAVALAGCDQGQQWAAKMDAEERGYVTALAAASISPTCRKVVEHIKDWQKFNTLGDDSAKARSLKNLNQNIGLLRTKATSHFDRLDRVLPPDSYRGIHDLRLEIFRYVRGMGAGISSRNYTDIEDSCLRYYKLNERFKSAVAARPVKKQANSKVILTFKAAIIPFAFHSSDGFRIQQGFTTPFGTITAAYANKSGAKLLVIRTKGAERYFSLDQPFEVFVPARYGVSVSGDGKGRLTITVRDS